MYMSGDVNKPHVQTDIYIYTNHHMSELKLAGRSAIKNIGTLYSSLGRKRKLHIFAAHKSGIPDQVGFKITNMAPKVGKTLISNQNHLELFSYLFIGENKSSLSAFFFICA